MYQVMRVHIIQLRIIYYLKLNKLTLLEKLGFLDGFHIHLNVIRALRLMACSDQQIY